MDARDRTLKTLTLKLSKYGLILLALIAIYNMMDAIPLLTNHLDAKTAQNIYYSYQPAYTSEPTATDWAYPQNKDWKGNKGEVNPILENMPNHIFYTAVFIMFFAMSGFIMIMIVNTGRL